jgi:hypothetical protein
VCAANFCGLNDFFKIGENGISAELPQPPPMMLTAAMNQTQKEIDYKERKTTDH